MDSCRNVSLLVMLFNHSLITRPQCHGITVHPFKKRVSVCAVLGFVPSDKSIRLRRDGVKNI
eukprot:3821430-Karenia_brevis.AAC.1